MGPVKLTRREFTALLGSSAIGRGDAAVRPPNWVILFCDDLGYGDPGCYGNRRFRTPNIDRLASEGARLTEFYAAPTCTPARGSLLTGRYPLRSGLTRVLIPREHFGLPESEITLASVLRPYGYRTACVGKWHLGDLPRYRPNRHGFDYYYGLLYSSDMTLPVVHWPAMRLYRNERVIEFVNSVARQRTLTRRFTGEALQFIEESARRPFLLYLPYTAPHLPCAASQDFAGQSGWGCYGDTVEELDWSVGEILSALRRLGIERDTVVLFSSDNGPEITLHRPGGSTGGLRGGKRSTWEGGVRVPAIVRWPGRIPAGQARPGIASVMDIFSTAISSAGGKLPSDRIIDGLDLLPFLQGETASPRSSLCFHRGKTLFALRSGPWKLHFWKMMPGLRGRYTRLERCRPPELYSLVEDPGETRDLAGGSPETVAELTRRADEFRASIVPGKVPPPRWRSVLPSLRSRKKQ